MSKKEKEVFAPEVHNEEYECPDCKSKSVLKDSCGRCGWSKKSGK